MNSLVKPLLAAIALTAALHVPTAQASLILTGTSASGNVNDWVAPSFTIDTSGMTFATNNVGGWDFRMSWDSTALEFNPDQSKISVNGATPAKLTTFLDDLLTLDPDYWVISNPDVGSYDFSWIDFGTFTPLTINSVLFTGAFRIKSGAPGDVHEIDLFTINLQKNDSMICDESDPRICDSYDTAPGFRVIVNSSQPIPEPGMLVLLLGGMAAYLGAVRLRRGGRG